MNGREPLVQECGYSRSVAGHPKAFRSLGTHPATPSPALVYVSTSQSLFMLPQAMAADL